MTAGRPSLYTPDISDEICARLAAGETLRHICLDDHMPASTTVIGWAVKDALFSERYARARAEGLDVLADEIIALADECRPGDKTERKEISRACSLCGKDLRWIRRWRHSEDGSDMCAGAEAEKVEEVKVVTGDMVERSRLQIDTRKWLLSKLRPDKYGDRLNIDATVSTVIDADVLRAKRAERLARLPKELPAPDEGRST